jgi:hypothetical protein
MKPQYKFYATLLDAFLWYQRSESEAAERELIDKINRVPVTDADALRRMNVGVALNELVDRCLVNKEWHTELMGLDERWAMEWMVQGQRYYFNAKLLQQLVKKLEGSTAQVYTETLIRANGKDVLVYGYMDYLHVDKVVDLKHTSNISLGKYRNGMQRHVYPICLFNSGAKVNTFEYLITDGESIVSEPYEVDLMESNSRIAVTCSMLIEFIEAKRHLITDKKIFAIE